MPDPTRLPFAFLSPLTPRCPDSLLAQAHSLPVPRTALVNAGAENALQGLREAADLNLALPVLIGDTAKIRATAETIGWDISGLRLEHAPGAQASARAAELARMGEIDSIMKGQVHTTTFLKGLLPTSAGLREKGTRCAHVFHITLPHSDRPLLLSDGALNVDPGVEIRKACLLHAVALAHRIGIAHPKVALLGPTEDPIPSVPNTLESVEITAWARDNVPDATVQGPMAMDLILSAEAARDKNYHSPVAGDADIIITPNITSGNALFKLMVLGMGACAAGIVLGAKVPILLTSRAQKSPSRIATAALGVVAAART